VPSGKASGAAMAVEMIVQAVTVDKRSKWWTRLVEAKPETGPIGRGAFQAGDLRRLSRFARWLSRIIHLAKRPVTVA